jgi:transposase
MGVRRRGRRCGDARVSSMAILNQAAAQSSDVTDVRYYRRYYRGRGYYGNPGAAIGLGILGAAAGVAALGAYGAYGPSYYGGQGYYGGRGYYGGGSYYPY